MVSVRNRASQRHDRPSPCYAGSTPWPLIRSPGESLPRGRESPDGSLRHASVPRRAAPAQGHPLARAGAGPHGASADLRPQGQRDRSFSRELRRGPVAARHRDRAGRAGPVRSLHRLRSVRPRGVRADCAVARAVPRGHAADARRFPQYAGLPSRSRSRSPTCPPRSWRIRSGAARPGCPCAKSHASSETRRRS